MIKARLKKPVACMPEISVLCLVAGSKHWLNWAKQLFKAI